MVVRKYCDEVVINVKEAEINNIKVNMPVTFEVKESDKEGKWMRIGGVALSPIKSRNGITYTTTNIEENDGVKAKFFMTHDLGPDNVVGHVTFAKEGDNLVYDARIRNTAKHQDVMEMAKDKFFDVSIDGRYKTIKRMKEESETKYVLEGLEIRGLCGVGVGGIPTNSVDYAIAEEFKKIDEKNVTEENIPTEVLKLEEDKLQTVVVENEKLQGEVAMLRKKVQEQELSEKVKVVKEIMAVNSKDFKEEDLMSKEIKELEMILGYEKKLAKEEETEENGESEVEETKLDVEEKEDVVIEKDGDVTASAKLYAKFNEDIRNQIPKLQ